jgi:hypothetical protein
MRRPSVPFVVPFALAVVVGSAAAQIRPGPWQTAGKVPDGWVVHNTRNYHIQSQCGLEKAKRLGEHMEVMNVVYRRMFKPDKDGAKLQTIKLFKDAKAFRGYGAPDGAAAYYSPGEREMVCYDTGKWSDETAPAVPVTGAGPRRARSRFEDMMKMDLLGCAAHEGWHQYYHWLVVSRVALPSWINEGMGDYFYTAAPKEGKGKKAELGRVFDGRLWILQAAKRQGRLEPLAQFLEMLQQDYYSNPSICYAQGWAFCQFLLHGANGKYAKVIPAYVRMLCNDTNWRDVQAKAFKGLDLAAMETEFHAYIDTLKPSVANPLDEEEEDEAEGMQPPPPPAPDGGNPAGTPPAPPTPAPTPPPAGGGPGGNGGPGGG